MRSAINAAEEGLKRTAIRSAGRLRDAEATAPIVAALSASRDENFMSLCIEALASIGAADGWSAVVGVASNERAPPQARRTAIRAIGEKSYAPGEASLIALIAARGADRWIKRDAIDALANFNDDAAVAAIGAATENGNSFVSDSALRALARIDTPRARETVLALVANGDRRQSREAMRVLAQGRNASAIAPLRAVLADAARSGADRSAAFAAIKVIDPAQITDAERTQLWAAYAATREQSESEQIARALIEAGFNDRSVLPQLVAGLDERRNNRAWYSNVLLLRHLTGQTIGPINQHGGNRQSRQVEFDRWRAWAAAHPEGG